MVEEQTEMSLDEVLSSIKQMVVDKDPPVLELTDMVSPDGTIVRVKNGQKNPKDKSELRDFLRLAQENGRDSQLLEDPTSVKSRMQNDDATASGAVDETSNSISTQKSKELPKSASCKNSVISEGAKVPINEIVREVAAPLIKEWLEKNLPSLAREVVTVEIQKMIKQS